MESHNSPWKQGAIFQSQDPRWKRKIHTGIPWSTLDFQHQKLNPNIRTGFLGINTEIPGSTLNSLDLHWNHSIHTRIPGFALKH